MKLIIKRAIDKINIIIKDEMKNLDDKETKIMMEERKIPTKRLCKNQMNLKCMS